MIPFFVVCGLIVWAVAQGRESRVPVWKARVERFVPVGRYLRADAQALWEGLRRPQRLGKRSQAPDYLPDEWNA